MVVSSHGWCSVTAPRKSGHGWGATVSLSMQHGSEGFTSQAPLVTTHPIIPRPEHNITFYSQGVYISSVLYESPVTRVNCEGNCYTDRDYSTERQIDTSASRDRTIVRLLERELRTSAWFQLRAVGLPHARQSVTNTAVLPPSLPPSPC